jgi:hypothetical protein
MTALYNIWLDTWHGMALNAVVDVADGVVVLTWRMRVRADMASLFKQALPRSEKCFFFFKFSLVFFFLAFYFYFLLSFIYSRYYNCTVY